MPWSRDQIGGRPCGSTKMSSKDASSSSSRVVVAVVVRTTGASGPGTPCQQTDWPYRWNVMVRAPKSHRTGPSVASHCVPNTMS